MATGLPEVIQAAIAARLEEIRAEGDRERLLRALLDVAYAVPVVMEGGPRGRGDTDPMTRAAFRDSLLGRYVEARFVGVGVPAETVVGCLKPATVYGFELAERDLDEEPDAFTEFVDGRDITLVKHIIGPDQVQRALEIGDDLGIPRPGGER